MHVGHVGGLGKADKAADLQVLTDGHDLLGQDLGHGQVALGVLALEQSVHIGGVVVQNDLADVLDKLLESFALGAEVGLAVDFHNGGNAALGADAGISHAFGGHAAGLLGGLGQALLTQPVDCLFHIAVGGLESLLAVHHADVGHLTERFHILSGECHGFFLLFFQFEKGRCFRRPFEDFVLLFLGLLDLGLGGFGFDGGVLALTAFLDGVGHRGGDQADGADGVIVRGDDVIDLVGIAVGVDDGDDGDVQLAGFGDGVVLLAGIDDEQRAGQLAHVLDAAEVLLELLHLAEVLHDFLLRQHVEGAVLLHLLELGETVDAGAHGLEVGQHAAEPAGVDVVHADAGGLFLDGVGRLLLGADEQDRVALLGEAAHEGVGFLELLNGLLQVDDINTVAFAVDILGHLGVPAAGLVSEVDAGFQQLLHGYDCHLMFSFLFLFYSSGRVSLSAKPFFKERPHGESRRPCEMP